MIYGLVTPREGFPTVEATALVTLPECSLDLDRGRHLVSCSINVAGTTSVKLGNGVDFLIW